MTVTVNVNIDGPRDPGYVLELAEARAEITRALNHLTRDPQSLAVPSDADRLLRCLDADAERLPQLLEQVTSWLEKERQTGRIGMAGTCGDTPEIAVLTVAAHLQDAAVLAERLGEALKRAAAVTSDMAAEDDSPSGA